MAHQVKLLRAERTRADLVLRTSTPMPKNPKPAFLLKANEQIHTVIQAEKAEKK